MRETWDIIRKNTLKSIPINEDTMKKIDFIRLFIAGITLGIGMSLFGFLIGHFYSKQYQGLIWIGVIFAGVASLYPFVVHKTIDIISNRTKNEKYKKTINRKNP